MLGVALLSDKAAVASVLFQELILLFDFFTRIQPDKPPIKNEIVYMQILAISLIANRQGKLNSAAPFPNQKTANSKTDWFYVNESTLLKLAVTLSIMRYTLTLSALGSSKAHFAVC